jgi:hypothetical protein
MRHGLFRIAYAFFARGCGKKGALRRHLTDCFNRDAELRKRLRSEVEEALEKKRKKTGLGFSQREIAAGLKRRMAVDSRKTAKILDLMERWTGVQEPPLARVRLLRCDEGRVSENGDVGELQEWIAFWAALFLIPIRLTANS